MCVAVFVLGMAVGSFLNVVIYRLPRDGMSIVRPLRSFCPNCLVPIAWYDNIPILSWLLLRGRCRSCHKPIHFRYPLVELICALLALSLYSIYGISFRLFFLYYFTICLVAIAFIDLDLMVIPDQLNLPTMFLGLLLSIISPDVQLSGFLLWDKWSLMGWPPYLISLFGSIMGGLLGFFALFFLSWIYLKWRKRKGMGDGDPLLLATIGVFLGWRAIFPVIMIATILALAVIVFLIFSGRIPQARKGEGSLTPIPFGPFLSLAAILWLFYGEAVTNWYYNFMGLAS